MIRKFFLLFIFFPYFLFSQSAKETEIVILHVNDIHGRIDKMPYLSTMIKEIQAKHKNVLLFSAGDLFSGNPIVDKYSEKGFPIIDIMNMLPFSLSTIGNHELILVVKYWQTYCRA
jgi:2',3'-cyclic-nucleotide 2'-phosphodiesterase (5'-nucleotidase family)